MAETRITFRGKRMNVRTRNMLLEVERLLGYQLTLIQGSYNAGGVSASAGTHDGGGALDVWGKGTGDATLVANTWRKVGSAAWHRTPAQGNWGHHVHCIMIGDDDLSRGAQVQVNEYKNGYNGLAGNGKDYHTRVYVNRTWESYLKIKAAAGGGTGAVKPAPNAPILHVWGLNYATSGKGMSDVTLTEAYRFMAFARARGAIKLSDEASWKNVVKLKNWPYASKIFKQAIKNVQHMGGLYPDGIVGPKTAAHLRTFGYNVI